MTSLTEFLSARLDEDEAVAKAAVGAGDETGRWVIVSIPYEGSWPIDPSDDGYPDSDRECQSWTVHASRHDPAHVLAQVEALRAVVAAIEEHREGEWEDDPIHEAVLRPLASVYRDHPDYDQIQT